MTNQEDTRIAVEQSPLQPDPGTNYNRSPTLLWHMDAEGFRERVEAEMGTELDRLGSSKLLVGLTGGDLTRRAVLELAANSEHAARETFAGWADDEDHHEARDAFEVLVDQEREHAERVAALLEAPHEPAGGGVLHSYLRGRGATIDRVAAGMVGRPMYSVRAYTQIISFFVNEADEATADVFRELKADTDGTIDRGCGLLASLCEDAEDWDRAAATAGYAIQLVYDDYADALAELGLSAKSVC